VNRRPQRTLQPGRRELVPPKSSLLTASTTLMALMLPLAAARAEPVDYGIDPTHTFVHFELPHRGTSITRGRWDRKEGMVTLDRAARRGRVEITIDMASISTGVPALDAQLRGKNAFDVAQHPQARFVGDRFLFDGEQVSAVGGALTLRGRTHPVTLNARRFNCYLNPLFRREVCGGDFDATLKPSLWGLGDALGAAAPDEVQLRVQVEAIRQ
jgi:polyisoprenoid-binding protein YceI